MTTATQHHQHQPSQPSFGFAADTYDPDDVVTGRSPLMTPLRPKLEPSPSPPPDIPAAQVSLSPSFIDGRDKSNRNKIHPTSGDAVLVAYLDNNRDPEIARAAGLQSLPYDEDSPDEEPPQDRPVNNNNLMSGPLLQHLAADALQAASLATAPPSLAASVPKTIPDISIPTGQLSIHDEPPTTSVSAPRYIPGNRVASPLIPPSSGPLPPLQHGVCVPAGEIKETPTSQSLPSLRSTFGDFRELAPERLSEPDLGRVPSGPSSTFPTSPVGNLGHRFSLTTNLPSSPRSPPDGYRTLSPHSATSGIHYYTTNSAHPRAPTEYSSSNAGETPNTDHSGSTPATSTSINSTSITDRMSIDGITHPQPISDDPQLRDVLAQRPDGPNRGRRRRGPPS
ncbi:hypothetical protein ACHAP7_009072 [Fusarium lateritium]